MMEKYTNLLNGGKLDSFDTVSQLEQGNLSNSPYDHDMPLVSVIIPTYNHADFVTQAIRSVLNQKYDNYEVIVVDDGSKDHTRQVVSQFGSKVHYIWQENKGLAAARNTGIRLARGEYIGLLDADDLFEPEYLNLLVSILEGNKDVDAVYCVSQTVDLFDNPLPQRIGKAVPPDELYETLLYGGFFPPICMFAHKYCYEQAGMFDNSFRGYADIDMWLRFSKKYTVIGTEKVLARYRIVPQSMSSDPIHMLNDRLAVLQKYLGPLTDKQSQSNLVKRQAYAYSYLNAALDYLQLQDKEEAFRYLHMAFDVSPDLLSEYNVLYMLGLGNQPRGFRGDLSSIEIQYNAKILLDLLNSLFNDQNSLLNITCYRRTAYANAYLALGLLSYGARQFRDTRRFLLLAIVNSPKYIFSSQLLLTFIKSLFPVKWIYHFKSLRLRLHNKVLS